MSHNTHDDLPPSYTMTTTNTTSSHSPSPPPSSRNHSILDQVTLTRAYNIHATITAHILPLVEQQASYGIAHTTIALLPSDIPLPPIEEKSEFSFEPPTGHAAAAPPANGVEVIGFSSGEAPKVVRLEGLLNRTEFWRPQAVIEELERVLRDLLNRSERLRGPGNPVSLAGRGGERRDRQREGEGEGVVGLVLVKVRLEEICLRTVNEFGLYDTMSRQCVIIRVDARC